MSDHGWKRRLRERLHEELLDRAEEVAHEFDMHLLDVEVKLLPRSTDEDMITVDKADMEESR